MVEVNEQSDEGRESASLGLRITALAVDWWIEALTLTVVNLAVINSAPVTAVSMRSWLERLGNPWYAEFAILTYRDILLTLAFRLAASVVFGTTPGRRITGLRIVTDLGGLPVGRARLAFREFLAGLFFSLPVVNIIWLSPIIRHSRSPGRHEEASKTTVVRVI